MNLMKLNFLALLFLCQISLSSYGRDIGVVGRVYPIAEENFLKFILHRFKTMQENGEWQKIQNEFQRKVARKADRPEPVSGITKTTELKIWNEDPSIVVPNDLYDAEGRVFAKAGTIINPFKYITLHSTLIFFDGDDKSQVELAKSLNKKLNRKTKLILVNGSITRQRKQFDQPIYFDQSGNLTAKFHIKHVPALIKQDGVQLKIMEVVP